MIQSKRIAELMDIYKQAEKCYKYNQSSSFYRCLSDMIINFLNSQFDFSDVKIRKL